jgi:hypothetical protein
LQDSTHRSNWYNAKTVAATVGLKIAAVLPDMKTGFSAAVTELVAIEDQVRGLLNANAVPTIYYPFYQNFGRELWKLTNNGISGTTLDAMGQALHDKYVSRGLATARLIEIADTIFNVTVT